MSVQAMERLHYIDEPKMFLVNVGAVMERLHYIDEPKMFLVNVGAGDGKTTLYR